MRCQCIGFINADMLIVGMGGFRPLSSYEVSVLKVSESTSSSRSIYISWLPAMVTVVWLEDLVFTSNGAKLVTSHPYLQRDLLPHQLMAPSLLEPENVECCNVERRRSNRCFIKRHCPSAGRFDRNVRVSRGFRRFGSFCDECIKFSNKRGWNIEFETIGSIFRTWIKDWKDGLSLATDILDMFPTSAMQPSDTTTDVSYLCATRFL